MRKKIINQTEQLHTLSDTRSELNDLLLAHLHKQHKVNIFTEAFDSFFDGTTIVFKPTWSWYAFLSGPLYFFYRKLYKVGIIVLMVSIVCSSILQAGAQRYIMSLIMFVAVCICPAIIAKYCYIKKFTSDLNLAKYGVNDISEVKQTMSTYGGYNKWAIAVYAILVTLIVATHIALSVILIILSSN